MARNVLEYLERSASLYPDKDCYEDEHHSFSFADVKKLSQAIGTALISEIKCTGVPVAIYLDKNVESIVAHLGVVYSGNFYCPIDTQMPSERINVILSVLEPQVIITNEAHREQSEQFNCSAKILLWDELIKCEADERSLSRIRQSSTELDPLYVLFTSGSTGIPKGVLLNHRVILNYLEWLGETFRLDENTVFGNQAPLYFDISMHDVYGALFFGAKTVIIPQKFFGFPLPLINYMNEKKISSVLWVPSAMSVLASLKAFRNEKPAYLKQVMFAGEVLPRKHLDYWMDNLPDAVYANLYGPTETFVCTGYVCTGNEAEGRPMPIGKTISNTEACILDENDSPVLHGETGELCIRGSCLAMGYYNDEERTKKSFAQNPLHNKYPDLIYRTGDLVYLDENDDLIYVSRKDFQIKHMGYRIELGEIETAAESVNGVENCACVYDNERKQIILFYEGKELETAVFRAGIEKKLPQYMMPGKYKYCVALPHNANGKIDRVKLEETLHKK